MKYLLGIILTLYIFYNEARIYELELKIKEISVDVRYHQEKINDLSEHNKSLGNGIIKLAQIINEITKSLQDLQDLILEKTSKNI